MELDSDRKPKHLEAAIALLGCASKNECTNLRKILMKVYNIPKEEFLSYHIITKYRSKLVVFKIEGIDK